MIWKSLSWVDNLGANSNLNFFKIFTNFYKRLNFSRFCWEGRITLNHQPKALSLHLNFEGCGEPSGGAFRNSNYNNQMKESRKCSDESPVNFYSICQFLHINKSTDRCAKDTITPFKHKTRILHTITARKSLFTYFHMHFM